MGATRCSTPDDDSAFDRAADLLASIACCTHPIQPTGLTTSTAPRPTELGNVPTFRAHLVLTSSVFRSRRLGYSRARTSPHLFRDSTAPAHSTDPISLRTSRFRSPLATPRSQSLPNLSALQRPRPTPPTQSLSTLTAPSHHRPPPRPHSLSHLSSLTSTDPPTLLSTSPELLLLSLISRLDLSNPHPLIVPHSLSSSSDLPFQHPPTFPIHIP